MAQNSNITLTVVDRTLASEFHESLLFPCAFSMIYVFATLSWLFKVHANDRGRCGAREKVFVWLSRRGRTTQGLLLAHWPQSHPTSDSQYHYECGTAFFLPRFSSPWLMLRHKFFKIKFTPAQGVVTVNITSHLHSHESRSPFRSKVEFIVTCSFHVFMVTLSFHYFYFSWAMVFRWALFDSRWWTAEPAYPPWTRRGYSENSPSSIETSCRVEVCPSVWLYYSSHYTALITNRPKMKAVLVWDCGSRKRLLRCIRCCNISTTNIHFLTVCCLRKGHIGVESAGLGHGTKVFFELPLFRRSSSPSRSKRVVSNEIDEYPQAAITTKSLPFPLRERPGLFFSFIKQYIILHIVSEWSLTRCPNEFIIYEEIFLHPFWRFAITRAIPILTFGSCRSSRCQVWYCACECKPPVGMKKRLMNFIGHLVKDNSGIIEYLCKI